MKKSALAILINVALLSGCQEESLILTGPETELPEPEIDGPAVPGGELPDIGVEDPIILGEFSLDGHAVFDDSVLCNGEPANAFKFSQKETVTCTKGSLTLATFVDVFSPALLAESEAEGRERLVLKNADEYLGQPDKAANAKLLIEHNAVIINGQVTLGLENAKDRLEFESIFNNDLDLPEDAFLEVIQAEENDSLVDKQPTTHVPDIEPEVSPNTSTNLNGSFVSANAEESYQHKPEKAILSKAILKDSRGLPVVGVSYFSASSRGKTSDGSESGSLPGEFEFLWGESVSFGIDTFELGSVRGNQTQFKLSDLGDEQKGRNADALVRRYGQELNGTRVLRDGVESTFARYPNVINEIISLSLNDKDTELDLGNGTSQVLKAEFNSQFTQGLALEIDQSICGGACTSARELYAQEIHSAKSDMSAIQADIAKLWGFIDPEIESGWKPVQRFHVFHDSTNFYARTGDARGQTAVNISNTAFPIMMARNDNNYWLSFNEKKAWSESNVAYITEAPSTEQPALVSGATATFNLPFVSLGEIGAGKIMMVGNSRYNSILVCPNGYSWDGELGADGVCSLTTDSDDMKHFFQNSFKYLTDGKTDFTVGTNIPHVYFKQHGQVAGRSAEFIIDKNSFSVTTEQLNSFVDLSPSDYPLLILNGFDYKIHPNGNAYLLPLSANQEAPKFDDQDVTHLIDYVSRGGSILIMETVLEHTKGGELARLLDSAGIAFASANSVVRTPSATKTGPRGQHEEAIWVLERYASENVDGEMVLPYKIVDGKVIWTFLEGTTPGKTPELQLATWTETDDAGKQTTYRAFLEEKGLAPEVIEAEKQRILDGLGGVYKECTDSTYHYEVNCLERRPGNGIPVSGGWGDYLNFVPRYTELNLGEAEARAMIKAADLGTNIERLFKHEEYFRSSGTQGERLSSVDLNRIYQNMTVWLWNDLDYRFETAPGLTDELGFERFTQYLNCYTNDKAGGNTTCPADLKASLNKLNMVYGSDEAGYEGLMNPSYPLNYMEKPLTRLMLGRSFWDYDVKVDIRQFPGEPTGIEGGASIDLNMTNNGAVWYAGNRQPTGQWAVAHQPFTVTVTDETQPVIVTVALHDDLTGRDKHELGLKRPPRMTKSFTVGVDSQPFVVPYGGLVYVQGGGSESVKIDLAGTVDAPLFDSRRNHWINPIDSPAPIGEVISSSFVYTAPKNNLKASRYDGDLSVFGNELDQFANDLNDFYARNETVVGSRNRKATDKTIPTNRHHFVNDIAISIGAAHSGYPVMNSSFNVASDNLSTTPLNDWLIWHEVGHNAAEAPFNVEGATEVVNNLLALYMQDKHLGKMERVARDIQTAPQFVTAESGHAWAAGGAGERLVMFAQLKEWAETEFDITKWYQPGKVPAYYDTTTPGMKGWNMFKLMHRLTRNQSVGDLAEDGLILPETNKCFQQGLGKSDALMMCASYVAQTDLTQFFDAWNPGGVANLYPGSSTPQYVPAVTPQGITLVKALGFGEPEKDPLKIDAVTERKMH
ncbi:DUF4092 domain-containing protein [Vibrio sinensis]|uniref:DUF4092 domain-containing protein n=1 Tax=Vibrio sinensis TaxID=2302434 RepID=A0A3A6Q7N3_9VIBR|nr:SslE/AcfD family lipoprotein zinc metalloprotease [Vibrio sinensis]RJX67181.1 DUF4092 domain-containing protein [Vibrio sinensis]